MTMTYVVTLTCAFCKASLRYENERPDWKTYDYRVEMSDECERSARFVSEHADDPLPMVGEVWTAHNEAGRPRFISVRGVSAWGDGFPSALEDHPPLALSIPDPYLYVDCPVCDKQVKKP